MKLCTYPGLSQALLWPELPLDHQGQASIIYNNWRWLSRKTNVL